MTHYCYKCEEPMARDEEASLVDGKILCLDCVPEPVTIPTKRVKSVTIHKTHTALWTDLIQQASTMLTNIKEGDDDYIAEDEFIEDMIHFGSTCKAHGWCANVDEDDEYHKAVFKATQDECVVYSLQFALKKCRPQDGKDHLRKYSQFSVGDRVRFTEDDDSKYPHGYINEGETGTVLSRWIDADETPMLGILMDSKSLRRDFADWDGEVHIACKLNAYTADTSYIEHITPQKEGDK